MKAVSVSVMRNEADIVEAFVRYHTQFLDEMLIVDHRSTDSSADIVRKLQAEGLPVALEHNDAVEFNQSRITTAAARSFAERTGADWVYPLDIDEFIIPVGSDDIKSELLRLPDDRPTYVYWNTYVPTCSDDEDELNVLKRINHRLDKEVSVWHKVLLPAELLRGKRNSVNNGSHDLLGKKGRIVFGKNVKNLVLAHFPIRSGDQILIKIYAGWLSRLADRGRERVGSDNYKRLFDIFLTEGSPSCEELTAIAMGYNTAYEDITSSLVYDPLYSDFDLKYTSGCKCEPVVTVLRVAEEIAAELGSINASREIKAINNVFRRFERHLRKRYRDPLLRYFGLKGR